MNRIPLVAVDDLTPEQQQIYSSSASGKLNLFRVLAQARTMQPGIGLAIRAMMTDTDLPPLEREICILAVLHLDRGARRAGDAPAGRHPDAAAAVGEGGARPGFAGRRRRRGGGRTRLRGGRTLRHRRLCIEREHRRQCGP